MAGAPGVLPAPATLDDALGWFSWVAVESAGGRLDPKAAMQITKAIEGWVRSQGYAVRIKALEKQLTAFSKAKRAAESV